MIRVEKLSLSYRGGLAALRSIDLHISPRENIALIGANGSGKTTLAHCLNGLLQPQTGRVLGRWHGRQRPNPTSTPSAS